MWLSALRVAFDRFQLALDCGEDEARGGAQPMFGSPTAAGGRSVRGSSPSHA